jgi:hypothetical protein
MRKWRNRKYGGFLATQADVADALVIAEKFQNDVVQWFAQHHPTLLQP